MFEAAETGRKLSKKAFEEREPELHTRLLEVQRRLPQAGFPVIVLIAGVEGSGRGQVVNRLNGWLDSRGVRTHAFWDETEEERDRPFFWRFWRRLPPRGSVALMLGSWYTRPIVDRAFGRSGGARFRRDLQRVREFEQMLCADGALILKFWLHISRGVQRQRLATEGRRRQGRGWRYAPFAKRFAKRYQRFREICEEAIRETDAGTAPWYVVDAENRRYRDFFVADTLERGIRGRLDAAAAPLGDADRRSVTATRCGTETSETATVLASVPLHRTLSVSRYRTLLERHQRRLNALAWKAWEKRRNVVAIFEGWDAAGKGGAIRRASAAIDARLRDVISVAAPSDEEKAQHYLWRFWRHLPRAGHFAIYDRSWYGRVLVERVEGFAKVEEWMRAYQEINEFEQQLVEHGLVLLKFWVHIDADEQLRRFRERERIPWKKHKITDEDWRNREKWAEYEAAVNDMVLRTSTAHAPWTLVAGNDKRHARVEVVKTFCRALERVL